MRAIGLLMILVGCFISQVVARGYVFSRFRPDAPNYGYGSNSDRWTPREHILQSLLGEEFMEEEMCTGRRCSSNDHCCSEHICVSFDKSGGTCLRAESHRKTYECTSDFDCNEGQVCELGMCARAGERSQYNEPCLESAECDIGKGLCCQVVRRHRQAPKKVCTYYKDPLSCLGHVDALPVKRMMPAH